MTHRTCLRKLILVIFLLASFTSLGSFAAFSIFHLAPLLDVWLTIRRNGASKLAQRVLFSTTQQLWLYPYTQLYWRNVSCCKGVFHFWNLMSTTNKNSFNQSVDNQENNTIPSDGPSAGLPEQLITQNQDWLLSSIANFTWINSFLLLLQEKKMIIAYRKFMNFRRFLFY